MDCFGEVGSCWVKGGWGVGCCEDWVCEWGLVCGGGVVVMSL